MNCTCSICESPISEENAAVLAMGGYGNPRYICFECEGDLDELTLSRDVSCISAAKDRISKKMTKSAIDDDVTFKALEEIFENAAQRRSAIEDGTYDFSDEENAADTSDDGVPEELLETEEDIENARIKEKKYEKIDKITNWICIAAIVLAVGFVVYRMFFA